MIIAAALALLSGCRQELRIAEAEYSDSIGAEGLDAGVSVSCDMEYLVGGAPAEVVDKVNAAIIARHLLFDEAGGSTDVAAAAQAWVRGTLEDSGFDAGEVNEDNAWMYSWEFRRDGAFTDACRSRRLQTYLGSYSDYTGGAHGDFGLGYDVFDMITGEIVGEADLFIDDYESPLCGILEQAAMESVPEEDQEMFFGMPEPNGNFSVSEEGITWIYNPYEIAAFAAGVIEVPVPWSALKPLLKPHWR